MDFMLDVDCSMMGGGEIYVICFGDGATAQSAFRAGASMLGLSSWWCVKFYLRGVRIGRRIWEGICCYLVSFSGSWN